MGGFHVQKEKSPTLLLLADFLPVRFIDENTAPKRVSDSLSNQSGVRGQDEVIRSVLD